MNGWRAWLIAGVWRHGARVISDYRREPDVKSRLLKSLTSEGQGNLMPVHRKRFRIEEAFNGEMPVQAAADDGDVGPMHREIMTELRAIRTQMAGAGGSAATETLRASVRHE